MTDFFDFLTVGSKKYKYYSLDNLKDYGEVKNLPFSLKVLLENLLRYQSKNHATIDDLKKAIYSVKADACSTEISFFPARVLMQDFTGVPAIVDLAAMRDAMVKQGGDPEKINPLIPVDLVIDHSIMVDYSGDPEAFEKNVNIEYARNNERYSFLKWGQTAFKNFRVVPPGTGICHQVNVEHLAKVVWTSVDEEGYEVAYPDTLVGTDSHTTMVNGLSVLGWGVGGIEAEAAMLGQPLSMLIPEVIGVKLTGSLYEGITATDLVLTITNILRSKGVVGKFVEFYGEGLKNLTLADRTTIANMAPEYGATCGFFPIDAETIRYLELTGRDKDQIDLVEAYAKAQGMWCDYSQEPIFTDSLTIDLSSIKPTMAGPKRPQDKVFVSDLKQTTASLAARGEGIEVKGQNYTLHNHDVVIAAITSCTNTSNPSVMIAAGLLAKKANARGLKCPPWVKTSLAPGSQVVTEYLSKSTLMADLNALGFNLVGYGCTTCIGNSGPLAPEIIEAIEKSNLTVSGVLSGNRNFEGRIHSHVKANYLASPPLVVAYALAGTTMIDLFNDPLGKDQSDQSVYLKDIWPSSAEVQQIIQQFVTRESFIEKYQDVFKGDQKWQSISVATGKTYEWQNNSTYIKNPPYFSAENEVKIEDIKDAKILAVLGDSITTDHISPAGNIKLKSPAGAYLQDMSISQEEFNSYGARRGNHEVMMRGTFANVRLQNEMVPEITGGITIYCNDQTLENSTISIYDAAMNYQKSHVPLVVFAGKEYGTGSSRDWAAKGTKLLGIKAVIAESFERIHRSNLVGMGIYPLQFPIGIDRKKLNLTGKEKITLEGFGKGLETLMTVQCHITYENGQKEILPLICRIDTQEEIAYLQSGGILPYVLNNLARAEQIQTNFPKIF